MEFATLKVGMEGPVSKVVLNRPEIRNAFNDQMLEDLRTAFAELGKDEQVRVIVLTGEGKAFSAGADLHWMGQVLNYDREENYQDSLRLAETLEVIYNCPKPVIGRINGPAVGGGTGLVAVCDIVIAVEDAWFAFSETRLGLVPAVISPFLLKRMGEKNLRELFLTAQRFSAARAAEMGLVNSVVPAGKLDTEVESVVKSVLGGGPNALAKVKELLRDISGGEMALHKTYTAKLIAELRMSEEGQEGMNAFLEKRIPRWTEE
jgi:methylglutaconyl-CoA hydratase